MSETRFVSEEGVNRILEKIALEILQKAGTLEEAAQIVRDAEYAKDIKADVVTKSTGKPGGSRLLAASISHVPGASPESVITAMEMLHTRPDEYIICLNKKDSRKVLSRHKDKEEALAAGKAASQNISGKEEWISMISGNVSDDGTITGPFRFHERWN